MKYSGLVSHQDADLFYILKIDDQQYIPQIDLSKLVPLVEVPFMGSLVVFKTESGVLTRAIRVSAGPEMTEGIENIKLMMLETGETTFVEFKNNLYEMPDEFKKMPALANLCKLDQVVFLCCFL